MPRAYDTRQLPFDRNPLQDLLTDFKVPAFDLSWLIDGANAAAQFVCFLGGYTELPEKYDGSWVWYLGHLIFEDPIGTLIGIGEHWVTGVWNMIQAPAVLITLLATGNSELPAGYADHWSYVIHLLLTDPIGTLVDIFTNLSKVGYYLFDSPARIICWFFGKRTKPVPQYDEDGHLIMVEETIPVLDEHGNQMLDENNNPIVETYTRPSGFETWTEYLLWLAWPAEVAFWNFVLRTLYSLFDFPCKLICYLFGYYVKPAPTGAPAGDMADPDRADRGFETWSEYLIWLVFFDPDSIFRWIFDVSAKLVCFTFGFFDLPEQYSGWSGYLFDLVFKNPVGTMVDIGAHWVGGVWGSIEAPAKIICSAAGYGTLPGGVTSWWAYLIQLIAADPIDLIYHIRLNWSNVGYAAFDRLSEVACKLFDHTADMKSAAGFETSTWTEYLISVAWPSVDSFNTRIKHTVWAVLSGPARMLCGLFGYWTRPVAVPNTDPVRAWETDTWTEYLLWLILDDPTSVFHTIVETPAKVICFLLGWFELPPGYETWAHLLWHALFEDPGGTIIYWLDHWVGGAWDLLNFPAKFICQLTGSYGATPPVGYSNWWAVLIHELSTDLTGTVSRILNNWSHIGYHMFDRVSEIACKLFDYTDKGAFGTWTEYLLDQFWPATTAARPGIRVSLRDGFYALLDGPAKLVCQLFGHGVLPVGTATWTQYLIDLALAPTPNFGSLATGFLSSVTSFFTNCWELFCALWDYVFGGNLYDGSSVTGFSPTAGAHVKSAWQALWGVVAPAGSTAPTAAAATLWNNVAVSGVQSALNGVFEPLGTLADKIWKLLCAAWDYVFGGNLYSGTAVAGWSPSAGANLSAAWGALWGRIKGAGAGAAPPASAAALGASFVSGAINVAGAGALSQVVIGGTGWLSTLVNGIDTRVNHAETVTIPALDGRISHAEDVTIPALDGRISHAEDVTIPALDGRISHAEDVTIPALDGRISYAEDVTIPALDSGIRAANTSIDTMHSAIIAAYGGPQETKAHDLDRTGYTDLINAGKTLTALAQSGQALGMNNSRILSIRDNEPLYMGMDATAQAVYPLPVLGSSVPAVLVPPGATSGAWGKAIVSHLCVKQDNSFNAVKWIGYMYGTPVTSFIVEIFKMDINGNYSLVWESADLLVPVGGKVGISTTNQKAWNRVVLPTPVTPKAGEFWGAAFVVKGPSGSGYGVVGDSSWVPSNSYAAPATLGMSFNWSSAAWGFAQDKAYDVTPGAGVSITSGTLIRRGPAADQVVVMEVSPPKLHRLSVGSASGASDTITLPAAEFSDALEVAADNDGNYYFLQDTSDRIVQAVYADGTARWMTVVTDASLSDPSLPQEDFSVGGMVVFPGGRVVLYDNDNQSLLSLDLNTFQYYVYAVDPDVDQVTAMCLNPQGSLLFVWNQSTSEIIWFSTRNYAMLGYKAMTIPAGWTVKDILADVDGFAYLSLYKAALSGCVLVRAHLGTGAVQWVRSTPGTAPAALSDALVTGTGKMCIVNDRDVVAVSGTKAVMHRNVHSYDVQKAAMTSGEPLPWWVFGTVTDDSDQLRYDPAVTYPDVLVPLSAVHTVIPSWVNTIFMVPVGGGGGGGSQHGVAILTPEPHWNYGFGGKGGNVATITAYRGVHFQSGDEIWADIGNGGIRGVYAVGMAGIAGGDGGTTTIRLSTVFNAAQASGGHGGLGGSASSGSTVRVPMESPAPAWDTTLCGQAVGGLNRWTAPRYQTPGVLVTGQTWRADYMSPVYLQVAGQSLAVGGCSDEIYFTGSGSGRAPGGGGSGGMYAGDGSRGADGNGQNGAPGAAWAIFSQRIV